MLWARITSLGKTLQLTLRRKLVKFCSLQKNTMHTSRFRWMAEFTTNWEYVKSKAMGELLVFCYLFSKVWWSVPVYITGMQRHWLLNKLQIQFGLFYFFPTLFFLSLLFPNQTESMALRQLVQVQGLLQQRDLFQGLSAFPLHDLLMGFPFDAVCTFCLLCKTSD